MAILQKPVALNVVQGFRGVVDFYYWKDIPVARAWPRKPVPTRTPALLRTHDKLREAFAWKQLLPKTWHDLFLTFPFPPTYCREDFKRTIALNLSYAGALVAPLLVVEIGPPVYSAPGRTRFSLTLQDPPATLPLNIEFAATTAPAATQCQQFKSVPRGYRRYRDTLPCQKPVTDDFIIGESPVLYPSSGIVTVDFPRHIDTPLIMQITRPTAALTLPLAPALPAPFCLYPLA